MGGNYKMGFFVYNPKILKIFRKFFPKIRKHSENPKILKISPAALKMQ